MVEEILLLTLNGMISDLFTMSCLVIYIVVLSYGVVTCK